MKNFYICLSLFLIASGFQGCQNNLDIPPVTWPVIKKPLEPIFFPVFRSLNYGNGILYKSNNETNIVYPTLYPKGLTGTFYLKKGCNECIKLNKKTGAIEVNQSVSGMLYEIAFITDDKKDTLYTSVVISGISYQSNIYSVTDKISPNYNATVALPPPAGSYFDTPPANENSAFNEGLQINNLGTIELTKTISNISQGTFTNGAHKDFKLYYRLNDPSKFSLNFVDLSIHYYARKKDIPEYLLDELNNQCTIRTYYKNARIAAPPRCRVIVIVVKNASSE